eukprot:m51a1_g8381 hypothetical protein (389) ;mRNA; r:181213-182455
MFVAEPVALASLSTEEGRARVNTAAHREYAPFVEVAGAVPPVLRVHAAWWSAQGLAVRSAISADIASSCGGSVAPSSDPPLDADCVRAVQRYRAGRAPTALELRACEAYCATFRYEVFHLTPVFNCVMESPARLLPLRPLDCSALLDVCRVRVATGRPFRSADLEDFSEALVAGIQAAIEGVGVERGVFPKTSFKSSKNDARPAPARSAREVLADLTSSRDVLNFLEWALGEGRDRGAAVARDLSVVLSPWEPRIRPDNEWRAFVHGRQLTAVSQQHWSRDVGVSEAQAVRSAEAVARLYDGALRDALPWSDVVLDVWVDDGGAGDRTGVPRAHLIECNPGNAWASSGSSLFGWVDDMDRLCNADRTVYVRWVAGGQADPEAHTEPAP